MAHPYSLIITVPLATLLSGEMEKRYGKDAHCIVIDEFVGMQVSLLAITPGLATGVIGFVLFRIFDILKPFPVGASQRIRGGFGVVADDILAGDVIGKRMVNFTIRKIFFDYPCELKTHLRGYFNA